MTRRYGITFVLALGLATTTSGQTNLTGDWPQWRGPDRTGLSRETGLLKQWPTAGPSVLWSINNVCRRYGSIAVAGDRIFVQGGNGRESAVTALARSNGQGAWFKVLGPAGSNDRGNGPRGTP